MVSLSVSNALNGPQTHQTCQEQLGGQTFCAAWMAHDFSIAHGEQEKCQPTAKHPLKGEKEGDREKRRYGESKWEAEREREKKQSETYGEKERQTEAEKERFVLHHKHSDNPQPLNSLTRSTCLTSAVCSECTFSFCSVGPLMKSTGPNRDSLLS